MEARGLQNGFRLSAWLIEPRALRVSGGGVTLVVSSEHMQVLLCLVEKKGEFVGRRTLRDRAYASAPHSDQKVRHAIAAWHAVFGDTGRHPRHIAAAGQDGYPLIAHFEPIQPMPTPERLVTAGSRSASKPGARRTLVGHVDRLLVELRRRRVFRVATSYLIGMWILLQVAEVTFAPLRFPGWWITALTILAVMGMPVMIVLSWTGPIFIDWRAPQPSFELFSQAIHQVKTDASRS
jgi:DNA-binding winged helix-turn-helix (wHTH) protein